MGRCLRDPRELLTLTEPAISLNSPNEVWGVAYEIPLDEETRKHLDQREAGGYSRRDVRFFPSGECCVNDDLKLPSSDYSSCTECPVTVFIASDGVEEYLGPQTLESIADVIAVAVGPRFGSGSGHDWGQLLG